MNLIETLKTSIYTTKHTWNTKLHVRVSPFFKKSIFSKIRHSNKSAFYADFYCTIKIVEGRTAWLVWGVAKSVFSLISKADNPSDAVAHGHFRHCRSRRASEGQGANAQVSVRWGFWGQSGSSTPTSTDVKRGRPIPPPRSVNGALRR